MAAKIINGKSLALSIQEQVKQDIADRNLFPHLAIILANDTAASDIYVTRKMEACKYVGISCSLFRLPTNSTADDIITMITTLNKTPSIHGIFLQMPIGDHLDNLAIIQTIDPQKDVDGLTYLNMGQLMAGSPYLPPCTPWGVMNLLHHEAIPLAGKHAVIIGRSLLFGKPMGQLLLQHDCTVTHCHSKTIDLPAIARQADILISATGQAKMVKADWVKPNAVVIDVGITRMDNNRLCGDVDFDAVQQIASAITPVPGGVGPMTVACLLQNTVKATIHQASNTQN